MTQYKDIYEYILGEEVAFTLPITVADGWDWGFKDHIKTSLFYKHGRLLTGNTDDKPVKNIVRPILNLQYRAEDIDVKDINIYVDDSEKYHLSFLVKKYHDEVFLKENDLDTFFDEVKEEKVDFGGSLVQKMKDARPEKVPLQSIVFCDQTDILSGPIGIKLFFSPDEFKEMETAGWGDEKYGATATLDEVIALSQSYKVQDKQYSQQSKTPGKYIEVYQVSGVLPAEFLKDSSDQEVQDGDYIRQLHFVTFYKKKNDAEKHGITLFKIRDKEERFKFVSRDKIYGRALGFGGVEELFEPQVWTNYSVIRKKEMIDAAAKTILKTTDAAFANRNRIMNMENLEVAVIAEGKDIGQIDTYPRNIAIFDKWVDEWQEHAQRTGSATDPLLGETPPSGTPFRLEERVVMEGKGIHQYRRGKFAKFIEEIYQDWIIPYIAREITKGTSFLAELTADEMEYVGDCLVRSKVNRFIVDTILEGKLVNDQEVEAYKQKVYEEFVRGGNKRFFEILKDEMKGVTLKVKVNVAGKQKDLALITDKLTNVFRQVFANPQILDDPRAAKVFNKIIEYSGLTPIDFGFLSYKPRPAPPLPSQPATPPLATTPPSRMAAPVQPL